MRADAAGRTGIESEVQRVLTTQRKMLGLAKHLGVKIARRQQQYHTSSVADGAASVLIGRDNFEDLESALGSVT